ncbi:MAG: hypothetical protein AAFN08_05990 [Cyanobacteria bacterium J06559_3]
MSFTDSDREKIRRYLGYSTAIGHINQIAQACTRLESNFPTSVETVQELLRDLERLQTEIRNARAFAAQTFSSDASGTRQNVPGLQLQTLKGEAFRITSQIAAALQLPIISNIWAGGSGSFGASPVVR